MIVDKFNGECSYNDEKHLYWLGNDTNDTLISVTTLIGKFHEKFDENFWTKYKALESLTSKEDFAKVKKTLLQKKKFDDSYISQFNVDAQEFRDKVNDLKASYERERNLACDNGTKFHKTQEEKYYDNKPHEVVDRFGIGGKFTCIPDNNELTLEKGIYPEYLIYYVSPDRALKVAGQIDLLVKDGNHIYLADYKGLPLDTKIPTKTGWSTIKDLQVGDEIFDKDGNITKIIHKSEIHNNPCYKITFDNGENIIADHEHRWEISFITPKKSKYHGGFITKIMTTEELASHLNSLPKVRLSTDIPKIVNPKPLNLEKVNLPIDPYILGVWLGDGSKDCGVITQAKNSLVWDEIIKRGYKISENLQHTEGRENTEMKTVYGLRTLLNSLNLIKNKHIPDIYQRASYEQRLDLLRGLMDTDGYYHTKRKRFVMVTSQEWQRDDIIKLLATFGIKTTILKTVAKCNEKKFDAWHICFSTNLFNPFLTRNQDVVVDSKQNNRTFRNIDKVELVDTVPTQCLEVDSPSHTFLCTEEMIVTHNTNKKIETKGFFDTNTKTTKKMFFPLNSMDDTNFWHYTMQLSTYAYMLQCKNPDFIIEQLKLIHYDHDHNEHDYDVEYRKDDVIKMFDYYKQKIAVENEMNKIKKIEF